MAQRKADTVSDHLLRRIVAGELEVGSLLPKEAELAEHYEVNRSVIREAIKLLEVHGLVQPIRRRGTEVLDPMASTSPAVLRAMLTPKPGAIDLEVLGDLLEIRAHLDAQMTSIAARRRRPEDLEAMDAIVASMQSQIGDRVAFEANTDALIRVIAEATQNRIYAKLVRWHQQVATDLSDIFRSTRPANEAHYQAIAALVELIRQGQAERLEAWVKGFHHWATPRILASAALQSGASLDTALSIAARRNEVL